MQFITEGEHLIIEADEGHKLTNGGMPILRVRLGKEASIGEWKEITDEEAEALKEELSKEE